ncbi:MAG TPA: lamin tail domain-containing protein [Pyrinomonadaceae bacterium]|jgi:hypothetical protein
MRLYQRVPAFVAAVFICGAVFIGRPASAQTQIQAGQVLISEFRLRGPAGAEDEFVELYNNTDQPVTVQGLNQASGRTVVVSNGQITGPLFTIPNGTVIPARGHLLGANSNGYSLSGYPSGNPTAPPVGAAAAGAAAAAVVVPFAAATPDRTWDFDVPDGSGVALFATTSGTNFTAATRLDAAGFTTSPALYREGGGIPNVVTANTEHTFYRNLSNGTPRDTNDNAADFLLVGTAISIQISRLGAPGPENLASPVVNNTTIIPTLLDPAVSSSSAPNRERNPAVEPNANLGTLLIRRTITNNTGQPVSRLRFRVVIITTLGTPASECPAPSCADLRALTSQDGAATLSNQQVVAVRGVRLEEPPEQPVGGGYNSSLSDDKITLASPLPSGQSISVVFKLGVMRDGPFRFFLNIEALNATVPVILLNEPAASGVSAGGGTDFQKRKLLVDTVQSAPVTPAAPASPAAPGAAPRNVHAPWFVNLTPPAPAPARAAEDEADKDDEGTGKKPEEAPPPSAAEPAPQTSPAATRRGPSKKLPAAAKARRGDNH